MNITTRTTTVSNVQLDDNIRVWLLEEEGFKEQKRISNIYIPRTSLTECCKCRHVDDEMLTER